MMKRGLSLFTLLILLLVSCNSTPHISPTQAISEGCGDSVCSGPENAENCPRDCPASAGETQVVPTSIPIVAPTSAPFATAENSQAKTQTMLYISGTTHIETNRNSWPDPDAFIAFFESMTAVGTHWSIGSDVGWLVGEPRAAEVIQKTAAMGVEWDVHVHVAQDRAKVAYLLIQYGVTPSSVYSGFLITELDDFSSVQTYEGYSWQPSVLWGAVVCPGHRAGCDDNSAGVWRPASQDTYGAHNPSGDLIHVGGGDHTIESARLLVNAIASGDYDVPVISFTFNVSPTTLTNVNTGDGVATLTALVTEFAAYDFVEWATIEATAHAWEAAGSVPSLIEMP